MNRPRLALLCAAVFAAGTGFWTGFHEPVTHQASAAEPATLDGQQKPDRPVTYYQDPDGKPLYSAEPAKTPDGRPYLPVFADDEANTANKNAVQAAKKILYYRHPMGLPDTSKTSKKDSMGMDYIAVYEGDQDEGPEIKLSSGKVQRSGVKTEIASRRIVSEPVRAPGTIQLDERRVSVISMRTEAFVDKVENITTGSEVRKGQPLMTVYSPDIVTAGSDYIASGGFKDGGSAASGGARQRLLNYAVSPQVIAEMDRTKRVPPTITWYAPNDGIVLERNVVDGMRADPGDVLFRLADHSVMWAMVDVAERDLAKVAEGQPVKVKVRSYPDRTFPGTVALVYPHLNAASRSVRVRIELTNKDASLRPDMYAEAEIDTGTGQPVVAVPDSAVIDSGGRQVVIVAKAEGRFDPRAVSVGRRGAGYIEIVKGVAEGEQVVTSANFLIDAESNLKAALQGMGDAGAPK